jgi:transposase-like protein
MAKHRTHSIEFKRQVAQEFLAGETLHGLAKRHDICRNLIRVWVQKYEAGAFEEDWAAATPSSPWMARLLRGRPFEISRGLSKSPRFLRGADFLISARKCRLRVDLARSPDCPGMAAIAHSFPCWDRW